MRVSVAAILQDILALQRQFDDTGYISSQALAAIEEKQSLKLGGRVPLRCNLLLGLVPQDRSIAEGLKLLSGAWLSFDLTPEERQRVRRQAARFLLAAGHAKEARDLMVEGQSAGRATSAASDLADDALILFLNGEAGIEHALAEEGWRILDAVPSVLTQFKYADYMWTLCDLAQCLLSVYLRSIDAAIGLGMRLPDLSCDQDRMLEALRRWTELARTDDRKNLHPEHRALQLLVLTVLGSGLADEYAAAEESMASAEHSARLRTAESWVWLGTACRLRGEFEAAQCRFDKALQVADKSGSVRVRIISRSEIARIAYRAGDVSLAYQTLERLRREEQLLQSRSAMPMSNAWREASSGRLNILQGLGRFESAPAAHVTRACAIIHGNPHFGLNTDDLAKDCGVSRRTLEVAFRQCLGESVRAYVSRFRIERVVYRLTHGGEAIKSVASGFGYPNSSALRREFSRFTGKSLSRFLRETAAS